MTAEIALRLSDVGFVWDANALKRKKGDGLDQEELEDEEDAHRPPLAAVAKKDNQVPSFIFLGENRSQEDQSSDEGENPPQQHYSIYY